MLFNSYIFLFVFLPITLITYFYLNKLNMEKTSKVFLFLASFVFYAWFNVYYTPILLFSILFNFYFGIKLSKCVNYKKTVLTIGIMGNIILLGYFKYMDFFIENFNWALNKDVNLLHLALPLGISYFTFQQIAFLVDSYRGETKEYNFLNYSLFITFFPQLLMGPIMHHKELLKDIK